MILQKKVPITEDESTRHAQGPTAWLVAYKEITLIIFLEHN